MKDIENETTKTHETTLNMFCVMRVAHVFSIDEMCSKTSVVR